jgi:ABC-type Fe3+-siderophore transport system permease subunit
MKRCIDRKSLVLPFLLLALILMFMANLLLGSVDIPVRDVFTILLGGEGEREV